MKQSLQLRTSQHLALTPQLQQSIRLLQLSTLELHQELETLLIENPLLERVDDALDGAVRLLADGTINNATTQSETRFAVVEKAESSDQAALKVETPDAAGETETPVSSEEDWSLKTLRSLAPNTMRKKMVVPQLEAAAITLRIFAGANACHGA